MRRRKGKREHLMYFHLAVSIWEKPHVNGWNHEVFIGLEWPEHSAGNNFLQNGEIGQSAVYHSYFSDSTSFSKDQDRAKYKWSDKWSLSSRSNSEFGHHYPQSVSLRPQDRIPIRKCKAVLPFKEWASNPARVPPIFN